MPMYNVIEDIVIIIKKTSIILWEYYRYEPSLHNAGDIIDFAGANHKSKWFKHKQKATEQTDDHGETKI